MSLRLFLCCAVILSSVAFGRADDKSGSNTVFTGVITDSICARAGSHEEAMHMSKDMGKTARECTIACVEKQGAKYVLYDPASKKTYRISDQGRARKYAGEKVNITGMLKENEIEVQSISAQ